MLTTKNEQEEEKRKGVFPPLRLLALVAFAAALAGCGPPGAHALLKGKKLLDEGDYAGAADEFKDATEVMTTNAQAWNYLGVAEQHAGQLEEAANAYQRALELDRDLSEAHYNLGKTFALTGCLCESLDLRTQWPGSIDPPAFGIDLCHKLIQLLAFAYQAQIKT